MRRGEIWWADFGQPTRSGPGYTRPCVIVSANIFNEGPISTVIVAVITSNLRLEHAAGNFSVRGKPTGLKDRSIVNLSQIMTLDKSLLLKRAGRLPDDLLAKLNGGLMLVLGMIRQ
jgi:mRNA interferase MazF